MKTGEHSAVPCGRHQTSNNVGIRHGLMHSLPARNGHHNADFIGRLLVCVLSPALTV
jgi:hypothetical protein